MSKIIAKSPEMLEKEERIKLLQKKIKKERTTLKSLNTRLKNTKQKVSDIQKDIFTAQQKGIEREQKLNTEIRELLLHCKAFKYLDEDDLELINDLLDEVSDEERDQESEKQKYEDYINSEEFEAEHKERVKGMFNQFKVEPPAEEKRRIRKIFIQLSSRFHPDKARNDKDRASFHSLMQQINEAYQANDINKLLELEQMYFHEEEIDISGTAVTVDLLDQHLDKLDRDFAFISLQAKRTSKELKALKDSEMGHMLSDFKQMAKVGFDLSQFGDMQEMMLRPMIALLSALKTCKKEGNLDQLHEDYDEFEEIFYADDTLMPPDYWDDENWDDDDDDEKWDNDDEDDEEWDDEELKKAPIPVKDPKFPIGSSVKIKTDFLFSEMIPWNLLDAHGRVIEAYQIDTEIKYLIELDSASLKEIPDEILDPLVELDPDFNQVVISTSSLKKTKSRDAKAQSISAYRKIIHNRIWIELEEEKRNLMESILLANTTTSDVENWTIALSEKFDFPTICTTCSGFPFPPNTDVEVTSLEEFDSNAGHQFFVKYKDFALPLPVAHFRSRNKELKIILELYKKWWDWYGGI